jgi:hypothetical protein
VDWVCGGAEQQDVAAAWAGCDWLVEGQSSREWQPGGHSPIGCPPGCWICGVAELLEVVAGWQWQVRMAGLTTCMGLAIGGHDRTCVGACVQRGRV